MPIEAVLINSPAIDFTTFVSLAYEAGTDETAPSIVRTCYSKILMLFDRDGLTSVWNDFERCMVPDHNGFLLEHNRGRA